MISIIAAIGKNGELGKDNKLIWHIKEDMLNFKRLTMGKKIVMGTNTYNSLPKRLEGREYIILSHSIKKAEDALIFKDFEQLLAYLKSLNEEVMVIGGSSIYKLFLPYADRLYLTEIDGEADADVYFPKFDKNGYKKEIIFKGEDNKAKYCFTKYER